MALALAGSALAGAGSDLIEAAFITVALFDSFLGFVVLLIINTPTNNRRHACFVQISFDDAATSNGRTVLDCACV